MRVALLAITDLAGSGQPLPRAFLRVAGASLIQYQLGLVLALDCQRLVCLARGLSPEVIALQHAAEASGLQFAVATSPRQLAGLVTAADDLVVISEGLFADPAAAASLLEGRSPAVLVQPVEGAIAAGYERIDLNRASAGIMRLPGELVERLHDLPGDCDTISALTRIALQSGIAMREVPAASRGGTRWRMVRSEAEAFALENEWLRERVDEGPTSAGRATARLGVTSFGASLLHAGNASNALSIGVLVMLAFAGAAGGFGLFALAFVLVALSWVLVEASRVLRSAERHALGQLPPAVPRADVLGWLIDVAFGVLILADSPRLVGQPLLSWMATPVILLLLLGLLPRVVRRKAAAWISDRLVLGLVLTFASVFGQVMLTAQLASIALIVTALLFVPALRD